MLLGKNKNEGSDSKSPNANMGGRVSERYPIGEWGCWIIDKCSRRVCSYYYVFGSLDFKSKLSGR